ncbi:MAG: pseudouridine-5'-phosphate glycosidase [Planctomycetota bacterium]
MNEFVRIAPEVRDALAAGRPVVALETAAVTHGLPREPLAAEPRFFADPSVCEGVRAAFRGRPVHAALGHALAAAVRAEGAVPATVGVLRGKLVIGLDAEETDELAAMREVRKISERDIAAACADGASGGTTVAATILACRLATPTPIRIFATDGIGGVHRGFAARPDISADLMAIRDGGTMVVTAGAKSILDLPATLELLDTLGIPTVGLGRAHFPLFLSPGSAALPTNASAADADAAARIFAAHRSFYPGRGMLLCVAPPESDALPVETIESAVAEGMRECERRGIHGPEVTPVLLSAVARATGGASLRANLAVLVHNAMVGARVAVRSAAPSH